MYVMTTWLSKYQLIKKCIHTAPLTSPHFTISLLHVPFTTLTHTHACRHTHAHIAQLNPEPCFCLGSGMYDCSSVHLPYHNILLRNPPPFVSGSRPHPVYLRHRLCFMKSKIFGWLCLSMQTH